MILNNPLYYPNYITLNKTTACHIVNFHLKIFMLVNRRIYSKIMILGLIIAILLFVVLLKVFHVIFIHKFRKGMMLNIDKKNTSPLIIFPLQSFF
ncbi:hypothetical protein SAMN02745136_04506 [Anaerocolumna jejuensis DSM 15929]|uniref:Uncharacterized protein n=1 Tax=Anaerocolumna jejuensis DSM 15929 TaxID=1121322 RepID=A0A1M6Z8R5_9FIRM|nr:hypothetical protein SAMN02745136_04506 [Anaerocolumna jejuensis DSM 15929]